MADYLTQYALTSIATWLMNDVDELNAAYVVSPDFDWDMGINPTTGKRDVLRPLPFAGITLMGDASSPWSISNGHLYERAITANIIVCCSGFMQSLTLPSRVVQSLEGAKIASGTIAGIDFDNDGLPLYVGAGVSGTLLVNVLRHEPRHIDQDEHQNLKFSSVILAEFTGWKDRQATVLENKGNMPIQDD